MNMLQRFGRSFSLVFLAVALLASCAPAVAPAQPAAPAAAPTQAPAPATVARPATPTPVPAAASPAPAPSPRPSIPTPAVTSRPKSGGVLNEVTWTTPESMDLLGSTSALSMTAIVHAYDGLVKEDHLQPGRIVSDLAERWTTSDDGTRLTFFLRKGVTFHDGRPLTSADAKYSVERWMKDSPLVAPTLNAVIKSVDTPDAGTLVITLKFPYPDFFNILLMNFVAVAPAGSKPKSPQEVIGTGPFKLTSYQSGVSSVGVKNKNYWNKGLPYLDGVNTYIITDRSTGLAAFRAGRIDMVIPVYLTADPYITISTVMKDQATAYLYSGSRWWNFYMPVNKKPWSDPRVRRAVFMAIDRKQAQATLERNLGTVEGVLPSNRGGMTEAELKKMPGWREPKSVDIDEAKRLLAEAGYSNGFSTDIFYQTRSEFEQAAVLLKDQLAQLGIKATLTTRAGAAFWDYIYSRSYSTYVAQHGASPPTVDTFLGYYLSGDLRNFSDIADPKLDEMIRRQQQTLNPEERKRQLKEIEANLYQNAYTGILFWGGYSQAWRKWVRDYTPGKTMYNNMRYEVVWLDK